MSQPPANVGSRTGPAALRPSGVTGAGRTAAQVIADPRDTASIHARLGPRPSIPKSEYALRRNRARQAAREAGLDGLVIWSMGGSTLDRYSNVFWLTNHYDAGNVYPDVAPLFTGFGQTVLILPVKGEAILVVNQPDWRDDLVNAARQVHELRSPGQGQVGLQGHAFEWRELHRPAAERTEVALVGPRVRLLTQDAGKTFTIQICPLYG